MEDQPFSLAKINLDIKADLSAPIIKLIDTVSAGIGKVWEPTHIRRMAKAEKEALILRAEGDIQAQEMMYRAVERLSYRELRRQRNIERIANQAALQLPETVSEEPVHEDWAVQFFEHSQDVCDEEMQLLWAQLLAGEVERPGSFSLRTLHAVKMLRRDDALLFKKFSRYLWTFHHAYFHYHSTDTEKVLAEHDKIGHTTFLVLEAIGLLSFRSDTGVLIEPDDPRDLEYFGARHRLSCPQRSTPASLEAIPLTDVGQELVALCDADPNEFYRLASIATWKMMGIKVELLGSDLEIEPEGAWLAEPEGA